MASKPLSGRAARVDLSQYCRKNPLGVFEAGFLDSVQRGLGWVTDRLRERLGRNDPLERRPLAPYRRSAEMD